MKRKVKDLAFAIKIPKDKLIKLADSLNDFENRFYNQWEEPKTDDKGNPRFKDGKTLTRPINAPTKFLKLVQRRILNNVLYKIQLPTYYFGGIKGKDAVENGRYHQGNKFFFLTDMKDFYPSITFRQVESSLRKKGFYPEVARIITRLCTQGGVIPQGCPTSSFLASLVVHQNAGHIFEKHQNNGLKVSIYVDDITFSSPTNFKSETPTILEELRSCGLRINFQKTSYCTKNPKVTGVQVKNNGIAPLPHTFDFAGDPSRSLSSRNGHLNRIQYIKRKARSKFTLE